MLCKNCGADFASDQLRCPYCNSVNEHALKLAKELQQYDKEYEKSRDKMLETGESELLKKVTWGLGIVFLIMIVFFGAYVGIYRYRFAPNSKYNVTGAKYESNKKLLDKYMKNKEYIRAFLLASATDPTTEYFENYPEYKDELSAIYTYTNILHDIDLSTENMDEGNNYRSLTETQVISLKIFYKAKDTEVKRELEAELDQYLRNFYQLTDDEIEELKNVETSSDFSLDGNSDFESVTKERMVKHFGK